MRCVTLFAALPVLAACASTPPEPPVEAPMEVLQAEREAVLTENEALRTALDRVAKGWRDEQWWADLMAKLKQDRERGGWVVGVDGNRVRISCGTREGYRRGDEFLVRRAADYVGLLEVKKVESSRSEGYLEAVGKGAPPRIGDRVVTRVLNLRPTRKSYPQDDPRVRLEQDLAAALDRNVELKYGLSYQWRDWENEKWWKEILAETGRKRPRRGEEGGPPVGD